jgi:hypothetical protein
LILFEESTARQHNIVALTVELDDLCVDGLANVWLKITNTTKFYE